jgi:hypothetical protein
VRAERSETDDRPLFQFAPFRARSVALHDAPHVMQFPQGRDRLLRFIFVHSAAGETFFDQLQRLPILVDRSAELSRKLPELLDPEALDDELVQREDFVCQFGRRRGRG